MTIANRISQRIRREVESAKLRWVLRGLESVGDRISISGPVVFLGRECIRIGSKVSIAGYLHVWGHAGVSIGSDVMIASHVAISSITHDPVARPFNSVNVGKPVSIGNNVWIGSHAFIGAGVTVGDNAIIGAGAVVLKDVESGTIVAGVPAKVLRKL
jgi:maltose O-acetyltransferase